MWGGGEPNHTTARKPVPLKIIQYSLITGYPCTTLYLNYIREEYLLIWICFPDSAHSSTTTKMSGSVAAGIAKRIVPLFDRVLVQVVGRMDR